MGRSQIIVRQVKTGPASPQGERFCLVHEVSLGYTVGFAFAADREELTLERVIELMIRAGVSEGDAFRLLEEARREFGRRLNGQPARRADVRELP
jgi:hypothetical protein